jgi:hypothetical protein
MHYMILGILTFVVMILGLIFVVNLQRREKFIIDESEERPQGHYLGICISLGIVLGMICGVGAGNLYDNIALGITFGTGLGLVTGLTFGNFLEQKFRDKLREATERERKQQNSILIFVYITAFILLGISVYLYLA